MPKINKKLKRTLSDLKQTKQSEAISYKETYCADYPKEKSENGNPYWRCVHCKITDPQINGKVGNHANYCAYRLLKESALYIESK